jgi:replicative DNA helicase
MNLDTTQTEKSVIQAFIVDSSAAIYIKYLEPEHFTDYTCQTLFKTIYSMHDRQESIDVTSLSEQHDFKMVSGFINGVITSVNIKQDVKRLQDRKVRREVSLSASVLIDKMNNPSIKTSDAIGGFQRDIRENDLSEEITTPRKLAKRMITQLENKACGLIKPLDTGYPKLDKLLNIEPGHLVIVAARPGAGKSILASNISWNVSQQGKNVIFISLEMSPEENGYRILSRIAGIEHDKFKRPENMRNTEWAKVAEKMKIIQESNIDWPDGFVATVHGIKATVQTIAAQKELSLVVIDYLQLIRRSGKGNTADQIG